MKKKKWLFVTGGIVLLAVLFLIQSRNTGWRRQMASEPTISGSSNALNGKTDTPESIDLGSVPPAPANTASVEPFSQEYSAQRAALLDKLSPLYGSEEKGRGILYSMVQESLGNESVPFLRDMLKDESHKDRWLEIAMMIAWLSDRDDEESVFAILEFIQRPNTWPAEDRDTILDHAVSKGGVLRYLGLFDSNLVSDDLRGAFTEEGAERLIGAWLNLQTSVEPRYLVYIIQSWAAKGLVLTRVPENISLVRENYEVLAHKMLSEAYREKEMTEEIWLESELIVAYAGALAENDMLRDMEVQEFVRLRDDSETWAVLRSQYLGKYLGESPYDDARTIMDKCPVCGKVAE